MAGIPQIKIVIDRRKKATAVNPGTVGIEVSYNRERVRLSTGVAVLKQQWNSGAFPLPVKDILGKVYSKLRNPTIAKLFRYVGIVENAGYGMNKLVSWETLTGMRPTIESDRTIAPVTFPLKSALQRMGEGDNVPANVPVNVPVNVPANLTETQCRILELIRNNPHITHLEMAKTLSITDKTAKRATKFLREIGLIERTGSDKKGNG